MVYIALFIVLLVLELLYIRVAKHIKGMLQVPQYRSSHTVATISGGGFIFYIAALCAALLDSPTDNASIIIGWSAMAAISFCDDFRPQGISARLICYIAGVSLILFQLDLSIPLWLNILLVAVGIAFLNAYNFMDGINGITAAYTAVVIGSLAWLNLKFVFIAGDYLWFMLIATVVFAFFNFRRRALCFAGDVGAITIGGVTLFILYKLILGGESIWWIVLVSVYGIDAGLTIIRRLLRGERIYLPHRLHLYQLLSNECGMSHLLVSSIYAITQAAVNICAILLPPEALGIYSVAVLVALSAVWCLAVYRINRTH